MTTLAITEPDCHNSGFRSTKCFGKSVTQHTIQLCTHYKLHYMHS